MQFAVNYSEPLVHLLKTGRVRIDLLKLPAWDALLAPAQALLPGYVHFPLSIGNGLGDAYDFDQQKTADWHQVESFLRRTSTRHINVHLAPLRSFHPDDTTIERIYEAALNEVFDWLKGEGISHVIYGDIFLDDLRQYRDGLLSQAGITGIYPLWKEDCGKLANEVIETGIATLLVCVDSSKLPPSFAGRLYDDQLLAYLPINVDPCGENGEFHSFVFDAPYFSSPVVFEKGELTERSYAGSQHSFWFLDLKEGLVF